MAWAKPEFISTLLCYHCFTCSVPVIFHKCKLISAKNTPRKWYYIGLLRLKGILTGLRCLSNSQIIPLQIPIALYQTRRNEVRRRTISNKQFSKTINHSFTSQELPRKREKLFWKFFFEKPLTGISRFLILYRSRSSCPEVLLRKGVLKICSKWTGEHPCRSAISINLLCNFIEIALRHGRSPVNLLHVFRTPFLKNNSRRLLLTLSLRKFQTKPLC